MKAHFVIDPLIGKRQQLLLATQLCRMVLKVRNYILPFHLPKQLLTHNRSTMSSLLAMTRMSSRFPLYRWNRA